MTSRPSEDREGRSTRQRMLDVAEAHFARKGYDGAHLESIASEVGVRKTALYYYFESKSALYTAVLDRIALELDRVVGGALQREDLDHVARLELLADDLNRLLASNIAYSQVLLRIFVDRIPVPDDSVLTPSLERGLSSVMIFYQKGRDAGAFRKLSARHFAVSMLGMLIFYYAGGETSATMLGIEDVVNDDAVAWRASEFREMLLRGVLR